jgi:serine/threonine-protein kinase
VSQSPVHQRLWHRIQSVLGRKRAVAMPLAPISATALQPGDQLGGYRIERWLASGAMGALYVASDPQDPRPVALKTLALAREFEGADLLDARARFQQEAGTAVRLRHPDIVTVHRAGEDRGIGFIAMELLSGCDLTRYTRSSRLLPEPVVLGIAARVADALAHAQTQGVVHRDIKPANVMVDLASGQVKVTDFGIARLSDASRTRSGLVLGTPAFMAPEQLAGASADARSDLYALGVMLFQLLTGELPYPSESFGQLLRQMAAGPPRSLLSLRPDLPAELSALVVRCLQREPAQRPADGHELAQALRRIQHGWPAGIKGTMPSVTDKTPGPQQP